MTAEAVMETVLPEFGLAEVNLSDGSMQSRKMLALINTTGRDVAGRGEWSDLFRTFTATGTTALPDDFARLTESGGVWQGSTPVRVVVSPEQWAFLVQRPSSQPYCRIANGKLELIGTTAEVKVNYVSRWWVNDTQDAVTQNGDAFAFPDRVMATGVIARLRRQMGMPYDDYLAEHEAEIESALRADRGMK